MAQMEFQTVRIDIDLIERIDDIKDPLIPRDPWIRQVLEQEVERLEALQRKRRKRTAKK